jgi:predicted transcriptional regulator
MGSSKTNLFTTEQNELALLAKSFAHPARIAIVQYLLKSHSCINSDLIPELGLAQATISQHLKELKMIGIIQGNVEGNSICYCIDEEKWMKVKTIFNNLFNQLDSCCVNK